MANNAYVQTFDVEHMPASIPIGRETETGVRELRFDVSAWLKRWPEMEISILPTAPGTAVKYPAAVRMEGTVAVWEISGSDTAVSGTGSVEIEGRSDGRRVVSASAAVIVFARTPGTEGDVPDYARPWVDEVLDAADRAKEAADRAEAAGGASDEAIGKAVAEYLTENPVEVTETDPTVPGWAKQANKPVYTAEEVGAQPAGDYVTGSGLEKAVDDALTKAKESGEFTGETGPAGPQGEKGPAGADGSDGYTPVRGTDYWTEDDRQMIVDDVLAGMGDSESGAWELLTNITLEEDAAIEKITYDAKYKTLWGRVWIPRMESEISTVNMVEFLGANLYYVKIGDTAYNSVIEAFVTCIDEDVFSGVYRNSPTSGKGMGVNVYARANVKYLGSEGRICRFDCILPAGTTIVVYGKE